MAAQGRNEGFHVLDEFVCEAIHASSVPLASPTNQGRNEGMSVVEELVFEASPETSRWTNRMARIVPDRHFYKKVILLSSP